MLRVHGVSALDYRQQDGHAQRLARLDSDRKSHFDVDRGQETIVVVSAFSNPPSEHSHSDPCLDGRGASSWKAGLVGDSYDHSVGESCRSRLSRLVGLMQKIPAQA
jgi:hypothetical protein